MLSRIAAWFARVFGRPSTPTAPRSSYRCERCGNPATVHVVLIKQGRTEGENHLCDQCAQRTLWIPNPAGSMAVNLQDEPSREHQVEVEKLIFSESAYQQTIVLREVEGNRRLSIITGYFEATALWWTLKREPSPRPLTHDAWLNTVKLLGAELRTICVHDRREDTYFAEARLVRSHEQVKVDLRPSDALVIALRASVPFLFTEQLLAVYGVKENEPGSAED